MRSVTTPLSRRSLLTGGLAGAALLCGATSASALASAQNLQVGGSTRTFALTGDRSLLSGGDLTTVSLDVDGGHMVGVTFPAGTSTDAVAVRTRRAGAAWSEWHDLPLHDSEPDPDTAEGRRGVIGSDPLWVGSLGSAATVQVRLPRADAATAQLQLIDAGESSALTSAARTTLSAPASEVDLKSGVARPTIRSRADWGADESLRKGYPGYSDTIKAAVVHHTADGGSYSLGEVPAVIRGMYRYHTVSLGWSDLGYNFVVDRFGGIWEGRAGGIDRPVVGAHAGGFNTDTFGVSMMGDFTSVAPPEATLDAVAAVIAWKLSLYDLPAIGSTQLTSAGGGTAKFAPGTTVTLRIVNAHRDVGYTACPGNVGFTKMDSIRSRVANRLASSPAAGSALSDIAAKYSAVGGAAALGAATGAEGAARSGGRYRHYQLGSIYFLATTGAHVVRGLIREKWKAMNWENSYLGFPVTDEVALRGGAFNHFQGGSIYWSPSTGANAVRGAIRDKWAATGWETGYLGYPNTDEVALPGGAFNHFSGGSVYWSPTTGAHVVRGAIRDRWAALGWEAGSLGYPTSDEYDVKGGKRSDFQRGSITWNAATGRVSVTS
jgi:uncharacterized protein with LGFP repeats